LQQFAQPWNQLRAMRISVDKASLSANPGLWSTIEATLSDSESFILLASPTAAQSVWVQREIEHYLHLGRTNHLLLVLTEGEIFWDQDARDFDWNKTNALPLTLRGAKPEEPLLIDMRWAKSGAQLSLDDARFSDAVASLTESRARVSPFRCGSTAAIPGGYVSHATEAILGCDTDSSAAPRRLATTT
jgi:Thoeris protein ThsB, TIR-like domain